MKSIGLGLLAFLFLSPSWAQDSAYMGKDEFKDKVVLEPESKKTALPATSNPADPDDMTLDVNVIPTMRRWTVHGFIGFQLDSEQNIKSSWTYSMIESPILGVGARFRINPKSWHHFNLYGRADFVYSQRQWDIQTAFGTSSLTDRQAVIRPYVEASWHPHFAHSLAVFFALGAQSTPIYKDFSLSTRGFGAALLPDSQWGVTSQLALAYMAGGGLLVSLGYDLTTFSSNGTYSAFLGGVSYGF